MTDRSHEFHHHALLSTVLNHVVKMQKKVFALDIFSGFSIKLLVAQIFCPKFNAQWTIYQSDLVSRFEVYFDFTLFSASSYYTHFSPHSCSTWAPWFHGESFIYIISIYQTSIISTIWSIKVYKFRRKNCRKLQSSLISFSDM